LSGSGGKTLWNEHYPTLAAFNATIDRLFRDIGEYGSELESLISGNFHLMDEPEGQIP
jgi:hypothetical protein